MPDPAKPASTNRSVGLVRVAIDAPLDKYFDYLPATASSGPGDYPPGLRVLVPFGARKVVGIVVGRAEASDVPRDKLKAIQHSLGEHPVIGEQELALARRLASYYHYPRGAALFCLLPNALRKPVAAIAHSERHWQATVHALGVADDALRRAPKQQALLKLLIQDPAAHYSDSALRERELPAQIALQLEKKGLARRFEVEAAPANCNSIIQGQRSTAQPAHNDQQARAIEQIEGMLGKFEVQLLEGVTGSGKTEVYLAAIDLAIARSEQAMVLVPEIGLTPQTIQRFASRFDCKIAIFHSGLSDRERLAAWLAAARGEVDIIIGTRSAVFTRCARLGLVIVDEEHDQSYKQQDSLHYNARDVAVMRGQALGVPVVLGSATASLESVLNAQRGRYHYALLERRATGAMPPQISFIDIRKQVLHEGLSDAAITAIADTLAAKRQAMIFINRRGFAPLLLCHDCGWSANCADCDARLTLHRSAGELRCHHCDRRSPIPSSCPRCQSTQVLQLGQGTERLFDALQGFFSGTQVLRIDSDAVRGKKALAEHINLINRGEPLLLVGTQMLAKGHDFKALDTVVILDVDQGLYNPDFRAAVKTLQLLEQVAGRAGRDSNNGQVLIQTHLPDHPLLQQWQAAGYLGVRDALLDERRERGLPPFTHMALLRADSRKPGTALAFLRTIQRQLAREQRMYGDTANAVCAEPGAAFMERRAGRHRAQMLMQANERSALHRLLHSARAQLEGNKLPGGLRLSIDVDPQEST
ncbi:MAG: primosomal protein N' [Pseudomonadales bacterium]|nr:primosomal protein N' [Pseudomonadales bacterium]